MRKKIIGGIVLLIVLFGVCGCRQLPTDWSRYFDLSDSKIIWNETIDSQTVYNTIYVILRKQKEPYTLTVKDFQNQNIASLQYIHFESDPSRADDNEYVEEFRQDIYLQLKDGTAESISSVIKDIEKLDFVKSVHTVRVQYD